TGENDKFYAGIAQHLYELLFYFRLQTRAKSTRRQIRIRDTKLPRHIKDRCIQHIRNHEPRFRSEIAGPYAIENRAAAASFPRPENPNWQAFHRGRAVSSLLLLQVFWINPEGEYPIANATGRI